MLRCVVCLSWLSALRNELCHIGSVLDSTFRLMLHVKRASLDLGLKERVTLHVQYACVVFRRLHRNRYQWTPSDDLPTLLSKYCLPFRFCLMTRLPVTQVHSTVLPVSFFHLWTPGFVGIWSRVLDMSLCVWTLYKPYFIRLLYRRKSQELSGIIVWT